MEKVKDWQDKVEDIANLLQKNAEQKCQIEVSRATNYRDGYVQGCEDLLRAIRLEILADVNRDKTLHK